MPCGTSALTGIKLVVVAGYACGGRHFAIDAGSRKALKIVWREALSTRESESVLLLAEVFVVDFISK